MIRQLVGDCRVTLPTLQASVAQAAITSPPYYGLRCYGTPDLVWGGDAGHTHSFEDLGTRTKGGVGQNKGLANRELSLAAIDAQQITPLGSMCSCGAWLGSLGLEPTPELYIEHLVECFRHVWRVLRDDGVLWLNLGDSYAGSNGNGYKQTKDKENRSGWEASGKREITYGTKPKDLLMMPFRVAMALQADGWWLRSVIPWLKRNSMPESVTDRPATSVEYVFLLAKSVRYFWDADAVRTVHRDPRVVNGEFKGSGGVNTNGYEPHTQGWRSGGQGMVMRDRNYNPAGRNRRNSDWFFESWQGLMLDEADDPLALVVNPQPFSGAHFATFPAKLVEPMIKASTRPGDTVLDPFGGAGTVGLVADRLGRSAILCELKADYTAMGKDRIVGDAPMFSEVAAD